MLEATYVRSHPEARWAGPRAGVWVGEAEESGRAEIPSDLDSIDPGPVLGALLASIDIDDLSGYDRVVVMRAHHRMAAHYEAETLRAIGAVSDHYQEVSGGWESELRSNHGATAEIGTALHLTRRAAENQLALALDMRDRLPAVGQLLRSGRIDARRARVMVDGTVHLPAELARRVVAEVADDAPSMTTGQLRRAVRKLSISLDPDDALDRYDAAFAQRRISSLPTESGTSHLFAFDLPPDLVARATRRINHIAKSLSRPEDDRTIDQIRADVFLDLLNGHAHDSVGRGVIDIRVDLTTLAELDENPADLAGFGPVIADIARKTARDSEAEFRYAVSDGGNPVSVGTTRIRPVPSSTSNPDRDPHADAIARRFPDAGQRRVVEMMRPLCAFPGCLMPSIECDLDHITAWSDGGATSLANLAPLCRHDHVGKDAGWSYEILSDGTYRWTSPLGHVYDAGVDEPPMRIINADAWRDP